MISLHLIEEVFGLIDIYQQDTPVNDVNKSRLEPTVQTSVSSWITCSSHILDWYYNTVKLSGIRVFWYHSSTQRTGIMAHLYTNTNTGLD